MKTEGMILAPLTERLGSNLQSIQVSTPHKLSCLFSKILLTNEACSEDGGLELHD
jgi:hypothetical protein